MSGGGTGTSKDQLKLQNQLQQQELDRQKAIQDKIMGSVGKYLSGDIGFDPAEVATLKAQFLNQNAANFNSAGQQVLSGLRARGAAGGDMPGGGDLARNLEVLDSARATSQSQGISNIDIQNLQQAITNKFNAASVASGQSAQIGNNIGIFGQGANNALDQYVKASNSGFMSSFAQGLGGGVASLATAGIGASLGGLSKYLGKASSGPIGAKTATGLQNYSG